MDFPSSFMTPSLVISMGQVSLVFQKVPFGKYLQLMKAAGVKRASGTGGMRMHPLWVDKKIAMM